MDAALELFQKQGYEKTSLKRICASLDISGPAVYYYFASKNELLVAAYCRRMESMLQAHDSIIADLDIEERIWTFAALHVRLQFGAVSDESYAGPYRFGMQQLSGLCTREERAELDDIQRRYLVKLEDLICEGIKAKAIQRVDPMATAFAIFGMSNNTSHWYRPGGRLTISDVSFMYADFALRMVGGEPPRRRTRLRRLVDHVLASHDFPGAAGADR